MLEQALADNEMLSKQLKAMQQGDWQGVPLEKGMSGEGRLANTPLRRGALDGTNNSSVTVSTACSVGASSCLEASPGQSTQSSMPSWSNVSSHPQEFEEPEVEPC